MRSLKIFGMLAIWILITASSCQARFGNGGNTVSGTDAAAGVGIGLYLVGTTIYCIANTEECFPDEEALQAKAEAYAQAQDIYTTGLRRHMRGDPQGLEWICVSAHQGYPNAQYFYGAHLYRRGAELEAEAVGWLQRAAAQGHREADMMLRQVGGPVVTADDAADLDPATVETLVPQSCVADSEAPAGPTDHADGLKVSSI